MKKFLIFIFLSVFFLSGCFLRNNTKDVIKITKVNKTSSLLTGIKLLNSGKTDAAIKFFSEYEEVYSQNPEYHYYIGQAYYKKRLYSKAYTSFKNSLALDSSRYSLYLNIADTYEKANIKNKAAENFANYVFKSSDSSKNIEIRNKLNKLAEPVIGNDVIGRISLADRADIIKNSVIGINQAFSPDTPIIFASIEVINSKKTDIIQIKWDYINDKEESIPVNSSEFNISGSKTVLLSIKSPVEGWPAGKYEIQVLVNNIKNSSLKFYIF
jgi:tetratricopeptide (TPR) repeat protein